MIKENEIEKALSLVIERLEGEREEIRSISGYPGTDELEKRNLSDSLTDIIRCNHQRYEEAMHRAEQREIKAQSKIDELAAQNERLRVALIECHNAHDDFYIESPDVCRVINETPADSLAHVRAEGAVDVHNKVSETYAAESKRCDRPNCSWCMGYFTALVDFQEEIDEIRQSAKQSQPDPDDRFPNCEMECGAHGTYCRCADEAAQSAKQSGEA